MTYTKSDILNFCENSGMLDIPHIQQQIEMAKRKEYLDRHTFTVWQNDKSGRWMTYLPNEDYDRGRQLVSRGSKKEIEDVIVHFWQEREENPLVKDMFELWITDKEHYREISQSTTMRYRKVFEKFCMDDRGFGDRKISEVSEDELEVFLKESIIKYNLTAKAYSGLRTIIYGTFKRGKKFVPYSITSAIRDMDISKRSFAHKIKDEEKEVFSDEEMDILLPYLMENADSANLGILLMFATGIRVGELVALTTEDIGDSYIRICKTETFYRGEDGNLVYTVKDSPKTSAGVRTVALPNSDLWLLKRIRMLNPSGGYCFLDDKGNRMKAQKVQNRLWRTCIKLGIAPKSPHKIRKTYGSILLDNGIDNKLITSQMGHTNISCTENYYHRNRKTIEKKSMILGSIDELALLKNGKNRENPCGLDFRKNATQSNPSNF